MVTGQVMARSDGHHLTEIDPPGDVCVSGLQNAMPSGPEVRENTRVGQALSGSKL
jgi:hypothetical protein